MNNFYYIGTNPSQDLYHYGMPRRSGRYPWGSGDKPYQSVKDALKGKRRSDYFTSERTIPKGTRMFRTVTDPNPNLSNKPTYVTYLEPDRDKYRGGEIWERETMKKIISKDRSDVTTYEHQMVLNEDLKIPSRETFKKSMNEVIKKNPNLFKESVESYLNTVMPEGGLERLVIGADDPKVWKEFMNKSYMERSRIPIEEQWGYISFSLGKADKLKEAIVNDLKRKGYNAMVDEAGVGGGDRGVDGIDPLIIFDPSVLNVKKTKKVSRPNSMFFDTQISKGVKYDKWQRKATKSDEKNKW